MATALDITFPTADNPRAYLETGKNWDGKPITFHFQLDATMSTMHWVPSWINTQHACNIVSKKQSQNEAQTAGHRVAWTKVARA